MIFFSIYPVVVWYLAAVFRRRMIGLGIVLAIPLPVLTAVLCWAYLKREDPGISLFASATHGLGSAGTALLTGYGVVVTGIAAMIWIQRRARLPHECHTCGYDLRGSGGGVCPECGRLAGASAPLEAITE